MTRTHRHRLDRIETADDEVVYGGGGGGLADKLAEMAARLATVTIIDDRDPAAEPKPPPGPWTRHIPG